MFPPVFQILNVPTIQSYVGSSPARIFDYGIAPQDTARPYIVFKGVSNTRYENISDVPCGDSDIVQVDVYSDSRAQARDIMQEIRRIFDYHGLSNKVVLVDYEGDTKLYRIATDVHFVLV